MIIRTDKPPYIRICNPNVLSIKIFNLKDRLLLRISNAYTQDCRITNPAGRKAKKSGGQSNKKVKKTA